VILLGHRILFGYKSGCLVHTFRENKRKVACRKMDLEIPVSFVRLKEVMEEEQFGKRCMYKQVYTTKSVMTHLPLRFSILLFPFMST
jgi:hypothetical protein